MNDIAKLEQKVDVLDSLIKKQENDRLNNSLFSPDKAAHYQELATKLASSGLTPKSYRNNPKDLFLAWEYGYQLGMSLAQAMQDVAIINGRPAVYGDALLALVVSHPEFEDIKEEPIYKGDELFGFQCTVKRHKRSPVIRKFDLEDAKKAKLLGRSGPWQDYRDRMLQMRARGFACRDAFADALKGIKSAEEYVGNVVDAEYSEVKESKADFIKSSFSNNAKESHEKNYVENAPVDVEEAIENNNRSIDVDEARHEASEDQHNSESDELITLIQISKINHLMKENKFTKERKKKAMDFYSVSEIEDLTQLQAEHFIKQLEKA